MSGIAPRIAQRVRDQQVPVTATREHLPLAGADPLHHLEGPLRQVEGPLRHTAYRFLRLRHVAYRCLRDVRPGSTSMICEARDVEI